MKLHLGCGMHKLEGWVNIDLTSPLADKKLDLRQRLPYQDGVADFIYSEHFLEHLTYEDGSKFLKECFRVLKTNGVMRLSTPSLEYALDKYYKNITDIWENEKWFPETRCRMINDVFYKWSHRFIYDKEELLRVLKLAGFKKTEPCRWRQSEYSELKNLEVRRFLYEHIVEATNG